ncbi:MAG: AP endonuclease, family 2 [Acetothermia bacterium 64_32]|nr:MAG: AP endonuclease, family 2 [Acetothermia bacterium 64_32]MBC7099382.1 sugar phosphate isomerase/epimerase [Candidatus Bipolaricaulota bacterium]HAF70949.1 xylose isomerase [Candidatus Acetothermia bacterium]
MERSQLGLATFLTPDLDLGGWIDLAAELALGWVELRADPGMAHPGELSPQARKALRGRLVESGLKVSLHVPIFGVNLTSPIPRIAEASLAEHVDALDLAGELGARVVVLHPGGLPPEYLNVPGAYERARSRLEFCLAVLLPRAERLGLTLAIENKQRGPSRDLILTPEEHLSVLKGLSGLGACLDFGHLHTLNGDPAGYVNALGGRLVHVHLHDNHGGKDEHLGLGLGSAPWREAVAALAEAGYKGAVILEIPDPAQLRESVRLLEVYAFH